MKKFVTLGLSAICAFSLVACGGKKDKEPDHGSDISTQKAQALVMGIKEKNNTLSVNDFTKLTYKAKIQMDDAITTTTHKFSKEDSYIYDTIVIENMMHYETIDNTKTYVGTTHKSIITNYFYITSDGKAVDAANVFLDSTSENKETGIWERDITTSNGYGYLAETLEESQTQFDNNALTAASEVMTNLLSYSTQMLQTFEPFLTMPTASMPGFEIKSNGEGHLYMKQDMSDFGIYYECEFNNYMLTYMKSVMDSEKAGSIDTSAKVITTEIHFQIGVCELSYPNLEEYTYNPNA